MTRRIRLLRNIGFGVAGFVVVVAIVTLMVVQTAWFREAVRQKIIATTTEATGGRVELGSFDFDVSDLRATVTNFVIHGREPQTAAPFVRVDKVVVDLRFFTSLKHIVDIRHLGVERPRVNVMVFADGTTSIPSPKESGTAPSNQSPLATVVDLAVDISS